VEYLLISPVIEENKPDSYCQIDSHHLCVLGKNGNSEKKTDGLLYVLNIFNYKRIYYELGNV